MGVILKRVKGGVYSDETTGQKYLLRPVDRDYEGVKKKPIYFIDRLTDEGKVKYISGLFETQKQGVYSLDFKDEITGMKTLYFAEFKEGGEVLYIRAKKPTCKNRVC
jgi:phage-related protein